LPSGQVRFFSDKYTLQCKFFDSALVKIFFYGHSSLFLRGVYNWDLRATGTSLFSILLNPSKKPLVQFNKKKLRDVLAHLVKAIVRQQIGKGSNPSPVPVVPEERQDFVV
jgi:hypothetical protein